MLLNSVRVGYVANVVASDVPLSVIAGVDMLPVNTGLTRGALSAKVDATDVPPILILSTSIVPHMLITELLLPTLTAPPKSCMKTVPVVLPDLIYQSPETP